MVALMSNTFVCWPTLAVSQIIPGPSNLVSQILVSTIKVPKTRRPPAARLMAHRRIIPTMFGYDSYRSMYLNRFRICVCGLAYNPVLM